jgi:hypothetical protein
MITKEWLSGFSDGESCFVACKTKKLGHYNVAYAIRLRADDASILKQIRKFFDNAGTINYFSSEYVNKYDNANRSPVTYYRIASIKDLYEKVIPVFDCYSLKTKKQKDFVIWKQIIKLLYKTRCKRNSRKKIKQQLDLLISKLQTGKKYKEIK